MKSVIILLSAISILLAFDPNPRFSGLGDNTLLDLDSLKLESPDGEPDLYANGITAYGGMVYDMNNHRILAWGGGHATTFTDAIYEFDLQTLEWSSLYTPTPTSYMNMGNFNAAQASWQSGPEGFFPRPISRHSYDLLAVPEGRNEFLMLREIGGGGKPDGGYYEGQAAHYDFDQQRWTFAPGFDTDDHSSVEYDPVSGKVIIVKYSIWVYDLDTRVSTKIKTLPYGTMGYADQLVYYPPLDKFYYFKRGSSGATFEITLDRDNWANTTCVQLSTTGSKSPHGEPGYAYDSFNRIIGGGIVNNRFYAFDPRTRQWSSQVMQGGTPDKMGFHCIDFDPVNNVFIFIDDERYYTGVKTWAYRYKNGTSAVDGSVMPASQVSLSVHPNPFVSGTMIRVNGIQESGVRSQNIFLEIFNLNGQSVDILNSESCLLTPLFWNATPYPPGAYLLHARINGRVLSKRLVLTR